MLGVKRLVAFLAVLPVLAVGVVMSAAAPASADTAYTPPNIPTSPTAPYDLGSISGRVTLNLVDRCSAVGAPADVVVSFGPNQGMLDPVITPSSFTIDCSVGQIVPFTVTFTPTTVPGTYANSVQGTTSTGAGVGFYWKFSVPSTPPVCTAPNSRTARAGMSAAAWNDQSGIVTWGPCTGIGSFDGNDWLEYTGVQFGDVSPSTVTFTLATPNAGRKIYVRIDSRTGPVVATLVTTATGADWDHLAVADQTTTLTTPVTGSHRVYLTSDPLSTSPYNFGVANIQSFQFL